MFSAIFYGLALGVFEKDWIPRISLSLVGGLLETVWVFWQSKRKVADLNSYGPIERYVIGFVWGTVFAFVASVFSGAMWDVWHNGLLRHPIGSSPLRTAGKAAGGALFFLLLIIAQNSIAGVLFGAAIARVSATLSPAIKLLLTALPLVRGALGGFLGACVETLSAWPVLFLFDLSPWFLWIVSVGWRILSLKFLANKWSAPAQCLFTAILFKLFFLLAHLPSGRDKGSFDMGLGC